MPSHTFKLPQVQHATEVLITENADHLINYIYTNQDVAPFNEPTVRVGLSLKTVLKAKDGTINSMTLLPVIEDLRILLAATEDPAQCEIYQMEIKFLYKCMQLDDLISLNCAGSGSVNQG
jgi:hypothetical protein